MKTVGLLVLVLLFNTAIAWAQSSYNRWSAQPVADPKPVTSASERGEKSLLTKAQQDLDKAQRKAQLDSVRLTAPSKDLLKRGIGQRMSQGKPIPGDEKYYEHTRRVPYPTEALRAEIEGKVTMRLTIDAAGQVLESQLVETTIPATAPMRDLMIRQVSQVLSGLRFESSANTTQEVLSINYKIQ